MVPCLPCFECLLVQSLPGSLNRVATGPPQIGFDFDFLDAAWDKSFEELRLFAKANGGVAHVSKTHPERAKLGIWCNNQVRRSSPA